MVMLADLLNDNATMHQVYPLTAAPDDWAGNRKRRGATTWNCAMEHGFVAA
jgi:hypothetical protein